MTPLRYARPNQCRFCTSRRCRYRILSECGAVDEISCSRHSNALERFVDATLPKVPRLHTSSTGAFRRGGDGGAAFARHREEMAEIDASRGAQ